MAINITDSTASIKLEITAAYTYLGQTYPPMVEFIDKADLQVKSSGDTVTITDKAAIYRFLFSDITTPAGADAAAKAAAIEAFKDTAGPAAPLPAGASTEAKQDAGNASLASIDTKASNLALIKAKTDNLDVPLSTRSTEATLAAVLAKIIAAPATEAKQDTGNTSLATIAAKDFATETTLELISTAVDAISANTSVLTNGAQVQTSSLAVTLSSNEPLIGTKTETAPATDTASSGLNGRLQRIAQRLTSLIALIPASLGQKTMANSLAVTLASDQTSLPSNIGVTSVATGESKFRSLTVGSSSTGEQIKASAGNLYKIRVVNRDVSTIVIKLYEAAAPTAASTPIATFTCAAGDGSSFGDSYNIPISFASAMGIRVSTSTSDGSTALPVTPPIIEISYL